MKGFLMKELGVFLAVNRKKQKRSQQDIARIIGYSNPNFIARIERGGAPIPLDKIPLFAQAYGIDKKLLARLVFTLMHHETYEALLKLLFSDAEMVDLLKAYHRSSRAAKKQEVAKNLKVTVRSEALIQMRDFLVEHSGLIAKERWQKKGYWGDPLLEYERTRNAT